MNRRNWLKAAAGLFAAVGLSAFVKPRGRIYDWRGPLDRPGRCVESLRAFDADTEMDVDYVFYYDAETFRVGRYHDTTRNGFKHLSVIWETRALRLVPIDAPYVHGESVRWSSNFSRTS
jgi:hypothetical protein